MAKLRPRARIIRTIGDQLISGPEAALIELVKNAFDADSPSVHIKIVPPSVDDAHATISGSITVRDFGHGMSTADIVDKWFEPATSDKVVRKLSPRNRTMLGAKGVGRFATARLGRYLDLKAISASATGDYELSELFVDWDRFESTTYLDQVEIDIENRAASDKDRIGVSLTITSLRDRWTKKQLELLVRELRRFASPVSKREDDFKIFVDLSAFTKDVHGFEGQPLVSGLFGKFAEDDDSNPLEIRPLPINEVFHYMVRGRFNPAGEFKGIFVNNRGDGTEQSVHIFASALTSEETTCGSVDVRLNIYDREGGSVVELFEKLGLSSIGRLDARRLLDENIGVGIYRGGFRIRPYGDAETDWLELERMRVQNPSRKLGLNQLWGIVEISPDQSSGLVERSSREGLEHNGAFTRLKRLLSDLLAHVESLRYDFRQNAGLSRKSATDTDQVKSKADLHETTRAIAKLPERYRQKVEKAMHLDSTALKTSIAELETYQQALASRSTLGLVMAQVLHDGRRFLSDITTRSTRLTNGAHRLEENSNFGTHFRASFGKEAGSIKNSATQLSKLFKSLDPISGKKRGRPKDFAVANAVSGCLALFEDAINSASIQVSCSLGQPPAVIHGYESDLMAALINIIDNAVHWLGTSSKTPRILRVAVSQSTSYVHIAISNNGPKIADQFQKSLFNPGFSLKPEGSGIGMAIARETIRASKGDVAFDQESEDTTFIIEMLRASS